MHSSQLCTRHAGAALDGISAQVALGGNWRAAKHSLVKCG
jgi:hypothetical protein